jgi:hypothetical protein
MYWNEEYFRNWDKTNLTFINTPRDYPLYKRIAEKSIRNFSKFELNQLKLTKTYDKNRFIIVKKSRQCGESTITTLYLAIQALQSKKNIFILTKNKEMGQDLLSMISKYYKCINVNILPNNNNITEIRLNNGSFIAIKIIRDNVNSMISHKADIIYIPEAAFIHELHRKIDTILPCLTTNGKLIIASTPNGFNDFKSLYDSSKVDNVFKSFDLNFLDNPLNSTENYEYISTCNYFANEDMIRQELNAEFVISIRPTLYDI